MKKFVTFLVAIILLISCVSTVSADSITGQLGHDDTTMEFTFSTWESKTISFTPSKTGMYAIVIPDDSKISGNITILDIYGNTNTFASKTWIKDNFYYFIYNLDQSITYNLVVNCTEIEYTGKISLIKWDNSLLLPDCESIQANKNISVTVEPGKAVNYLISVPTSGVYSIYYGSDKLNCSFASTMATLETSGFIPEYIGSFNYGNEIGCCWYLEAGSVYEMFVEASATSPSSGSFTDSFIVKSGYPSCGQYGTWDISKSTTVSLDKNKFEHVTYMIIPEKSGKYMLQDQEGIYHFLSDSNHTIIDAKQYSAPNREYGYVYDLKAGEHYFITFQCFDSNSKATATYSF